MATTDFPEIIVLDPSLRFLGSHHFQYDESIARGAQALGIGLRLFSHLEVQPEVLARLPASPAFADLLDFQRRFSRRWPFRASAQLSGLLLYLHENRWRRRELDGIFRALDPADRLVLVPTCGPDLNAALARSLGRRLTGRGRAVLVFHQPHARITARMSLRTLAPLIRAGKIIPATTNEALAGYYQDLMGCPVHALPWPMQPPRLAPVKPVGRVAGQPVRFLAIGGFRMEKGVDLLAQAIETLEPQIADGSMRFLIQGFPNPEVPDPEAERHFRRLQTLAARHTGVEIVTQAFDPAGPEYRRLFTESDVVLLPYDRAAYRWRDSAVLMEALAFGKPAITTEGTCMATILAKGGSGLLCEAGSAEDLVRAIRQMTENISRHQAEATHRREAWVAFHNPENYLRVVTALARPGADALRSPC